MWGLAGICWCEEVMMVLGLGVCLDLRQKAEWRIRLILWCNKEAVLVWILEWCYGWREESDVRAYCALKYLRELYLWLRFIPGPNEMRFTNYIIQHKLIRTAEDVSNHLLHICKLAQLSIEWCYCYAHQIWIWLSGWLISGRPACYDYIWDYAQSGYYCHHQKWSINFKLCSLFPHIYMSAIWASLCHMSQFVLICL